MQPDDLLDPFHKGLDQIRRGVIANSKFRLVTPIDTKPHVVDLHLHHLAVGDLVHGGVRGPNPCGPESHALDGPFHAADHHPVIQLKGLVQEDHYGSDQVLHRILGCECQGDAPDRSPRQDRLGIHSKQGEYVKESDKDDQPIEHLAQNGSQLPIELGARVPGLFLIEVQPDLHQLQHHINPENRLGDSHPGDQKGIPFEHLQRWQHALEEAHDQDEDQRSGQLPGDLDRTGTGLALQEDPGHPFQHQKNEGLEDVVHEHPDQDHQQEGHRLPKEVTAYRIGKELGKLLVEVAQLEEKGFLVELVYLLNSLLGIIPSRTDLFNIYGRHAQGKRGIAMKIDLHGLPSDPGAVRVIGIARHLGEIYPQAVSVQHLLDLDGLVLRLLRRQAAN